MNALFPHFSGDVVVSKKRISDTLKDAKFPQVFEMLKSEAGETFPGKLFVKDHRPDLLQILMVNERGLLYDVVSVFPQRYVSFVRLPNGYVYAIRM